jgi:hypothetical protein
VEEVGESGDVAAHRAPGKPRGLPRDVGGRLAAPCFERPIGDLLDEEEEDLILGDGVRVAVLLALAEDSELPLLRLVIAHGVLRPRGARRRENVLRIGPQIGIISDIDADYEF